MTMLGYLKRLVDPATCYDEANRRLIINILLLVGLQIDDDVSKMSIIAEFRCKNIISGRVGNTMVVGTTI